MIGPRSEFATLLAQAIVDAGETKQDFARKLHISPASLSQLLADTYGTPPIEVCLRLAEVAGLEPGRVLRAAGRAELAEQLQRLYTPPSFERHTLLAWIDQFAGDGAAVLADVFDLLWRVRRYRPS